MGRKRNGVGVILNDEGAMKKMKSGKEVSPPNNTPVKTQNCLKVAVEFLTGQFNKVSGVTGIEIVC